MKSIKKNTLRWGPNATYIELVFCVGGNTNFRVGVEGNTNFRVFKYQHVGIGSTKWWHWGSKPTPVVLRRSGI